MRIGLILDNPKRDLSGIILTLYHLIKEGHLAYVIPLYDQGYDVPLLNLDVLIVNYVRRNNIELLQTYKKIGIFIAVMDTEGGVLPESGNFSPEFIAKLFSKNQSNTFIDHYFFWGEKLHKAFQIYSGMLSKQLSLTGCPRYDYCHTKWRGSLGDRSSSHILVNLNFPSINPWWGHTEYNGNKFIFHSADEEIRRAIEINGLNERPYLVFENQRKKVFAKYLSVIRKLAEINPKKQFILRPHPFENKKIYETYFNDFPNVAIDSKGEVLEVINKSNLVINLNCSTSVETRLLGKIPVSLEFINSDILRNNINLPSNISLKAKDFDHLNRIIQDISLEKIDSLTKHKIMNDIKLWFYKADGNAAKRMATIISSFNYANRYSNKFYQSLYSVKASFKEFTLLPVIQGLTSLVLGSYFTSLLRIKFRPERKMKYANILEIKKKLEKIAQCEGKKINFKVKHARSELTGLKLSSIFCEYLD
jgi:surface carbohydrate biosynthesis protein